MYDDYALERRRSEVERHRENSGRRANVYQRFKTVGQGSFEFKKRVDFKLIFIEKPFMAYGSYVDRDELANLLEIDDDDTYPSFPLTSGHVTEWDMDENDNYVGAWVGVRVYFPTVVAEGEIPVPVDALPEVIHDFTFAARAIKDIPLDVRD